MINQSKGEYAYMLLDIEGKITAEVIKELEGLNGIIRVRSIGG
jgi:D-3-phosphoglycerate dehydrogenase